jgi:hypothetical protein
MTAVPASRGDFVGLKEQAARNSISTTDFTTAASTRAPSPTQQEDAFSTPPESPSRRTQARYASVSMPKIETSSISTAQHRKRVSDEVVPSQDGGSSKFPKTKSGRKSNEAVAVENRSFTTISTANTSFASTVFSQPDANAQQLPETAATSFATTVADEGLPFGGSASVGSLDSDWLQEVCSRYERQNHDNLQRNKDSSDLLSQASSDCVITVPRITTSVHYLVRELARQPLFAHDMTSASTINSVPMLVRWECARIAACSNVPMDTLLFKTIFTLSDYDEFWLAIRNDERLVDIPKKSTRAAWQSGFDAYRGYTWKGTLSFASREGNPKSLFNLTLDPLIKEDSCRFQRKFGSDRFLYLIVPSFKKLPDWLKGQEKHLQERFTEWLGTEHAFLGRKWRAFHLEEVKKESRAKRLRDEASFYRVVLFATSGVDILKKSQMMSSISGYHSCEPEMGRRDLVNWFMPLSLNSKMTYCKAYSRLDLGLSRTKATLVFKPSQVRFIDDTFADGSLEDTQYDDPSIPFTYPHKPNTVMNDGCARMSVGAFKEVWRLLGKPGTIPSAFQARIGTAKGVWMISGATDSHNADDHKIWIEITASQSKFQAHDADFADDSFDEHRLTFEVVKSSSMPSTAGMNLAFLPILEDRGVPRERLERILSDRLDRDRAELLSILHDTIALRKWVHEQCSSGDNTSTSMQWQAGLPLPGSEKVIMLLEAGFTLHDTPYLADKFKYLVNREFNNTMLNFNVRVGRSVNVIGIADPLGVLEPGEIHILFSQTLVDDAETFIMLDNVDVLVSRHPTLRPSDIQKVRATFKPELRHLVDVVVFSSKGRFPLAGKLQGGDYDGDVFWVSWEPALTETFGNAPAPVDALSPEKYGIDVDRRTVEDILAEKRSVGRFLQAGFTFRCNENLLGIVTKFHEKLCYSELRISSGAINACVDVHDLLVDSAKNGYIFDMQMFSKFRKGTISNLYRSNRDPPTPAYKIAMTRLAENQKSKLEPHQGYSQDLCNPKPDHIIDYLFFDVVTPHMNGTLKTLQTMLVSQATGDPDSVLLEPYCKVTACADAAVQMERKHLEKSLDAVHDHWAKNLTKRSNYDDADIYDEVLEQCFAKYKAIQPTNTENLGISPWLEMFVDGRISTWELVKASALYSRWHRKQKHTFIFHIAGEELAFIKSCASPKPRHIVYEMRANMKPKRLKRIQAEEAVVVQDEDDEGNTIYEDALENTSISGW